MEWLRSLPTIQIYAGLTLVLAKFFGLVAMATTPLASYIPAIPITAGVLWGLFLIACITLCIKSHISSKPEREKETYERLKKKYDLDTKTKGL